MSPQELANTCAERASWNTLHGLDPKDAAVLVVTPKGWKPPPRWPRGRIVRWNEDGSRVRYFPALVTLAWLVGHGLARWRCEFSPPPSPAREGSDARQASQGSLAPDPHHA